MNEPTQQELKQRERDAEEQKLAQEHARDNPYQRRIKSPSRVSRKWAHEGTKGAFGKRRK